MHLQKLIRSIQSFTQPVSAADCVRFVLYARRIKRIIDPSRPYGLSTDTYVLAPTVLSTLAAVQHTLQQTLLPSIEALEYTIGHAPMKTIQSFPSLLGPQLHTFKFHLQDAEWDFDNPYEGEDLVVEVLNALPRMASQNLRELELDIGISMGPIVPAFSRVICNYSNLVSLNCLCYPLRLPPDAVAHLSVLTSLEILEIYVDDLSFSDLHRNTANTHLPGATFPSLRKLTVKTEYGIDDIVSLLTRVSSPHLILLHVLSEQVDPLGIENLFEMVNAGPWRRLSSFTVQFDDPSDLSTGPGLQTFPHEPKAIGGELLRRLFSFTQMSCLKLFIYHVFDIDDAFLAEIAAAWPCLTELLLGRPWNSYVPPGQNVFDLPVPRVTLNGLIELVIRCPKLYGLTVRLDTDSRKLSDAARMRLHRAMARRKPTLNALNVQLSFLEPKDEPVVAAVLSQILRPEARLSDAWGTRREDEEDMSIECEEDNSLFHEERLTDQSERWALLDEVTINSFRLVREQERNALRRGGRGTVKQDSSKSSAD